MRRIVITGGTHAGKTTLVRAMGEAGFATVPEAALLVIDQLNGELGVAEQVAWRKGHQGEFQARVARLHLELEESTPPKRDDLVFCDRGVLDGLAYCAALAEPPIELVRASRTRRYAAVFVLDTIEPFVGRRETGRTSDLETSLRLSETIEKIYRDASYPVERLAVAPVSTRVGWILERLGAGEISQPARKD
jgi:predicted ATPase